MHHDVSAAPHRTRRAFLLGGIGLAIAGPASAKRRKHRRGRKRKDARRNTRPLAAPTPPDHNAILRDLAERMVHGLSDNALPLDDLRAMLERGEVVEAQCSRQSYLALDALRRAGAVGRLVGSMRPPIGHPDTGHVMIEVRIGSVWHCYDMTGNTRAVDADGNGISLATWCVEPEHHWRRIASDPSWPQEGDLAAFYDRVLGTPWIALSDAPLDAVFCDPANAAQIVAHYPWLRPVDRQTWDALQV